MELVTIVIRLGIVFILSLLFGLERQRAHKPVGMGTFTFVAIGAATLAIVAMSVFKDSSIGLLGAIVKGIGFLGAGALIRTSDKIFGFTTAASIWLFAIIGLVIGIGEYVIGALVYILVWCVVLIDKYLELRGIGSYQKKLMIKTNAIVNEKQIKKEILQHARRCRLIGVEIDKVNNKLTINYIIEGVKGEINKIPNLLYEHEWLESCKVE